MKPADSENERAELAHLLDELERRVTESAPFDLSPRGVRFRPDAATVRLIRAIATRGEPAVAALTERLDRESDALLAFVWLDCLMQIASPTAETSIDTWVDRIDREGRWRDQFPGQGEVLLYLGRGKEE